MLHRKQIKRWGCGLLALLTAISINLATPAVSQAGFLENILRGVLIWGVQSYQLSNLSNEDEVKLGKQIHDELVKSGQIKLYNNQSVVSYVDRIGQRLVKNSRRSDIPYVFSVVEDDAVNAFATMGGRVYINTGLIKKAANEAELASVLGHEVAHITEKHALNNMKAQARNQGLLTAAGIEQSQVVQLGVAIAMSYPNSRADEAEADDLGFEMLTSSGYAPEAMVSFMKKLEAEGAGRGPTFLSTHPSPTNRVARLQEKANNTRPATTNAPYQHGLDAQSYRNNVSPLL